MKQFLVERPKRVFHINWSMCSGIKLEFIIASCLRYVLNVHQFKSPHNSCIPVCTAIAYRAKHLSNSCWIILRIVLTSLFSMQTRILISLCTSNILSIHFSFTTRPTLYFLLEIPHSSTTCKIWLTPLIKHSSWSLNNFHEQMSLDNQ